MEYYGCDESLSHRIITCGAWCIFYFESFTLGGIMSHAEWDYKSLIHKLILFLNILQQVHALTKGFHHHAPSVLKILKENKDLN